MPERPASPTGGSPRSRQLAAVAILAGLALLAYANSFRVPFLFDDVPAIVANPSLQAPTSLRHVLWPEVDGGATVAGRPLVNLSFALNHAAGGLAVGGYHAVNLAIHCAAAWLLFGIVRRTCPRPDIAWPVALGSAALWLTHPLQTESVTYLAQRAESLAAFWVLLALYGFVRSVGAAHGARWTALSVAACLAGMATKETAAVIPVLVLLYDRTWVAGTFLEAWRRRRGYYLALASTWVLLGVIVAAGAGRGGTAGFGAGVSVWSYALTQCEAITLYLGRAIWPVGLVFDYGTWVAGGLGEVWAQALFVSGLVGAVLWMLVRRPVGGFFGAAFLGLLAPSSSVVPVASQTMAEHRMYLALAIPAVLAAYGLWGWLGRRALPVLLGLVLATTVLTVRRNTVYGSEFSIWGDTIAKRPDNARAYHNLGLAELARGNLDEAARLVRETIALAPESAEPHYSLGLILTRQGRINEAVASYEEALRQDPRHAAAHNNLANVLVTAGRTTEAGAHYAEAVRLQPNFAGARNSYGNWLIDAGRPAEGLAQCEEAVRLQPDFAVAHFNAGNACVALNRLAEAERHYRDAFREKTDYAQPHNNLGNLLLERDDVDAALGEYAEAVRLDPDYPAPRRALAFVLLRLGRAAEALPHLERLAQLEPGDTEVAAALAQARRAMGRR